MKIADLVLLCLFMRNNEKCNISHAPSTGISDIQFSILNVLDSLIPIDQKKYNSTEMKSGYFFRPLLSTDVIIKKYKNSGKCRSLESYQTKIMK